jgi:hypothetical protein
MAMQKLLTAAASVLLFVNLAGNSANAQTASVQPISNNLCKALAPAGWSVGASRGVNYTVVSPDHGMTAAYGTAAFTRKQVEGYQGPQYRRPALFAQYLAEVTAGEPIAVTASHVDGNATTIDFQSASKHGTVTFTSAANPSDPGGYAIALRIAIAGEMDDMPIAGAVAESIDCGTAKPFQVSAR